MRPQEITPLYTYGEARAQGGGKTTQDGAEIDGELRGAEGREAGGGPAEEASSQKASQESLPPSLGSRPRSAPFCAPGAFSGVSTQPIAQRNRLQKAGWAGGQAGPPWGAQRLSWSAQPTLTHVPWAQAHASARGHLMSKTVHGLRVIRSGTESLLSPPLGLSSFTWRMGYLPSRVAGSCERRLARVINKWQPRCVVLPALRIPPLPRMPGEQAFPQKETGVAHGASWNVAGALALKPVHECFN